MIAVPQGGRVIYSPALGEDREMVILPHKGERNVVAMAANGSHDQ